MESWRQQPLVFWTFVLPGALWLLVFFLAPLALVWILSFGERAGPVEIVITGTLANYLKALDPLYLGLFWKSFWIAGLATALVLIVAFPVALAVSFAPPQAKPLLLLLVILPFWTSLLIRTYAMIAVLRTRGYLNFGLEGLVGLAQRRSGRDRARRLAAICAARAALQQRRGRDRHRLRLPPLHGAAALRHPRAPRPLLSRGEPRSRRRPMAHLLLDRRAARPARASSPA